MSSSQSIALNEQGLVNQYFDNFLIWGVSHIAILSGIIVLKEPKLFYAILFLDLWLLGYPHVISTFTRLCFDKSSVKENKAYIFLLPFIVFLFTLVIFYTFGAWLIATIYLYWQWYHYTKQSWGISQVYKAKSNFKSKESLWLLKLSFYMLPLFGILYRSYQSPETFLFVDIVTLPVPGVSVLIAGLVTLLAVIVWAYNRVQQWLVGELSINYVSYIISHYAIFLISYVLIKDITIGWLVVNIWHNAQYILFVWAYNTNKYKKGIDSSAVFLSTISQSKNIAIYMLTCLIISTVIYYSIANYLLLTFPIAIVVYQTINFHHYIVDSKIWKIRKKHMSKSFELKTNENT